MLGIIGVVQHTISVVRTRPGGPGGEKAIGVARRGEGHNQQRPGNNQLRPGQASTHGLNTTASRPVRVFWAVDLLEGVHVFEVMYIYVYV